MKIMSLKIKPRIIKFQTMNNCSQSINLIQICLIPRLSLKETMFSTELYKKLSSRKLQNQLKKNNNIAETNKQENHFRIVMKNKCKNQEDLIKI